MERRFRQGKWMVEGLLVVEPVEAALVRRIFTRYLRDRLGVKELARELNAEGRRTRRGGPSRPSRVRRWRGAPAL